MGCPIYCSSHAGVSGNEQAYRRASTAEFTSGLLRGSSEVHGGLRNFLNMDRLEHHKTDRITERGRKPICVELDKHWHYFKGNRGQTSERKGGAGMGLPSTTMPS